MNGFRRALMLIQENIDWNIIEFLLHVMVLPRRITAPWLGTRYLSNQWVLCKFLRLISITLLSDPQDVIVVYFHKLGGITDTIAG